MSFSFSTFLAMIFIESLSIILLWLCLRSKLIYTKMGLGFLNLFSFIIIVRMLFPIELHNFTVTVPSKVVLPYINSLLYRRYTGFWGNDIRIIDALIFIWIMGTLLFVSKLVKK
ncbi:MAG: hypothetical protein Q4B70_17910, partial [Lachnospiraceae bacterium]|nr:hypothetical protein [Lachnospiraceae bacterium]